MLSLHSARLLAARSRGVSARLLSTAAVSILNPSQTSIKDLVASRSSALKFHPKSVLVAATPTFSDSLIEYVTGEKESVQAVGAVVDALPFGAQRFGVSILFLSEELKVLDAVELDPSFGDDSKTAGRSGADLTNRGIVSARRTWHMTQGFLGLSLGGSGQEIAVPLANTLFTSGTNSTLLLSKGHALANQLLSSVRVSLPALDNGLNKVTAAAPLLDLKTGANQVTAAKSNLLKTIDNRPAASFLEGSKTLMEFNPRAHSGTGEKKVFVSLTSSSPSSGSAAQRFEVTAGGGGAWSPRASMLVLEPQARPEPGMGVEFYLARDVLLSGEGEHEAFLQANGLTTRTSTAASSTTATPAELERVVLECAPVVEFEGEGKLILYETDEVLDGVFGVSSEQGFLLDDSKHNVPGEVVELGV